MGKLLAICTSPKRGTVKTEVPSAVLTPEWGIVEDAHGGNWHRQVSMLSAEKIEAFRKKIWVDYGAFGENLVIEGFDFRNLPVTSRFAIGDVVLEMTQIGKECHNDCVIKQQTGECIMPHEGVFARVLTGGEIHVGDEVTLLPALENPPLRAAVITLSDKGSRGEREDKSGPLIVEMLTAAGYVVEETMILPDEAKALKTQLIRMADGRQVNLVLTTGGTGFSPRDITPEATCAVADRNAPGIAEAMRYHSLSITPRGMLSRGVSVLRGKTLIVNLPGSPKAVQKNVELELQLESIRKALIEATEDSSGVEQLKQEALAGYDIFKASVINNSVTHADNYITLDKGEADGIRSEMGVVNGSGVVGIVYLTSPHYSIVIPVLNSKSSISCKIKRSDYFGFLKWDGGSSEFAFIKDMPRHSLFSLGDTIVTSGHSAVFPSGIPVGTVDDIADSHDGLSYLLRV